MDRATLAKILQIAGPVSVFEHLFRHLHSNRVNYITVGASAMEAGTNQKTPALYIWIGPGIEEAWRVIESLKALNKNEKGNARLISVESKIPEQPSDLQYFDIRTKTDRPRTVRVHIDRRKKYQKETFKQWLQMSDILNVGGIAVSIMPMEYVFWPPPSEDRTVVLAHTISPQRIGRVSRLFRKFYKNHRVAYFTTLALIAAIPTALLFMFFYQDSHGVERLILPGLHILTIFYLADILQSFLKDKDVSSNQKVMPTYLLIVSWLLPFILTAVPSLEQNINYSDLLNKAEQTLALPKELLPNICLQTLLVSSLVVFVPLEFFALFFLKDKTGLDRRHLLIAAGCLDIGTLIFLFRVANIKLIVTEKIASNTISAYLFTVFAMSFISSFMAIYTSQYREDLSTSRLR